MKRPDSRNRLHNAGNKKGIEAMPFLLSICLDTQIFTFFVSRTSADDDAA